MDLGTCEGCMRLRKNDDEARSFCDWPPADPEAASPYVVRLSQLFELGLSIECESGVRYITQTTGHRCQQRWTEGVFVPLGEFSRDATTRLNAHFLAPPHNGWGCQEGFRDVDADFIDRALTDWHLDTWMKVDGSRCAESDEAWVRVLVRHRGGGYPLFSRFTDDHWEHDVGEDGPFQVRGVLTWPNSD